MMWPKTKYPNTDEFLPRQEIGFKCQMPRLKTTLVRDTLSSSCLPTYLHTYYKKSSLKHKKKVMGWTRNLLKTHYLSRRSKIKINGFGTARLVFIWSKYIPNHKTLCQTINILWPREEIGLKINDLTLMSMVKAKVLQTKSLQMDGQHICWHIKYQKPMSKDKKALARTNFGREEEFSIKQF